jgi:hypothetical protein
MVSNKPPRFTHKSPIWDSPNLKEDIKKHKAYTESTEVKFKHCKHKKSKLINNEIRCGCGASWSGPRIEELFNLLTK